MTKQIIFIQGGGDGGYEADQALVSSLKENLGKEYNINYSKLQSDETVPDFGWTQQFEQQVLQTGNFGERGSSAHDAIFNFIDLIKQDFFLQLIGDDPAAELCYLLQRI